MPRITLLAVLFLAFSFWVGRQPDIGRGATPDLTSPAAPDEVLVKLAPEAWPASPEALAEHLDGRVIDVLDQLRVVRLELSSGESVADALERIGRLPLVEFVEPNHLVQDAAVPDDPLYTRQASIMEMIGGPAAWDVETGRPEVLVAVLDSGVDISHEDLAANVWTNPLEVANGQDDDGNGCVDDLHGCNFVTSASADPSCIVPGQEQVADDYGHGTFVAGIIAAVANNGLGTTGVAPGTSILPVKILDCTGGGTAADAARGILYAAQIGARVANISFGADGHSETLTAAIEEAYQRYGLIMVAATGNDGSDHVTFPAVLPQTFAVGSSGSGEGAGVRSYFSNWGPEVDFVAPGLDVVSTVPAALCGVIWQCLEEGLPYAVASGTSFAAPLVSGLAALLVAHQPNLSPETVRSMIADTAEDLEDGFAPGWDGAGRIRLDAALQVQRYQIGVPGTIRQ